MEGRIVQIVLCMLLDLLLLLHGWAEKLLLRCCRSSILLWLLLLLEQNVVCTVHGSVELLFNVCGVLCLLLLLILRLVVCSCSCVIWGDGALREHMLVLTWCGSQWGQLWQMLINICCGGDLLDRLLIIIQAVKMLLLDLLMLAALLLLLVRIVDVQIDKLRGDWSYVLPCWIASTNVCFFMMMDLLQRGCWVVNLIRFA